MILSGQGLRSDDLHREKYHKQEWGDRTHNKSVGYLQGAAAAQ